MRNVKAIVHYTALILCGICIGTALINAIGFGLTVAIITWAIVADLTYESEAK